LKTQLYKKCLLTLVISMSLLLLSTSVVKADGLPQLTIIPLHVDVADVGQTFSVVAWLNVSQANVTNLKGWEVKIGFNKTIVNCTSVSLMAGHPLEGLGISSSVDIENENSFAMHMCITMGDEYANVTETKPLCRFNFTALDYGDSDLTFMGVGLVYGTYMLDNLGVKIPFEPVPGSATVIPEFSAFMLMTFLMAATAVSVLAAKRLVKTPHT
jgi:hypothetical protein